MLIKLARNLTGGVNRLNPLIMRGNIRYLDLTSKVHLKGALGYISLGGSGGLLVHACLLRTEHHAPITTPTTPSRAVHGAAATTTLNSHGDFLPHPTPAISIYPTRHPPSYSAHLFRLIPFAIHLPPTTPQARITTKIHPKPTPTFPAIGHRRSGTVTHKTTPPLHLPHQHPHPSLQLHFCLLYLPLLALFLPIGLTETKAKKGINGTSLTNFNISPRIALWV